MTPSERRTVVILLIAITVMVVVRVGRVEAYSYDSNYLRVVHTVPEATVTPTPTVEPTSTPVVIDVRVSYYSNSIEENTNGRTALGQPTSRGMLAVAYELDENGRAIPVIPFGTQVELEGMGVYTVSDTCPACEENWFDVFEPDRQRALKLGIKRVTATIIQDN